MKKLGKKRTSAKQTVQAYACSCLCVCPNCASAYVQSTLTNGTSGTTSGNLMLVVG